MDSHLAHYLYDNEPPSESIIQEVEALLPFPLLQLSEMDAEISIVEGKLKDLRDRRKKVQRVVDDYRRILSPVRRLPDDILQEIFFHCLPQIRNPIMTRSEAPLLLTRVSSKWRSLALSSPRLWAQLHVSFCDDHSIPRSTEGWSVVQSPRVKGLDEMLRLRCHAVHEWLMRSGTCPLSISMVYTSNAWNMEQLELQAEGPTSELFKILLQFVERWTTIELRMPLEFYRKFEAMFPKSPDGFPSLTAVKVNFHPQTSSPLATLDPVSAPIVLFQAPNLRRLSLGGFTARSFWDLNSVPFADRGLRLSYICCHGLLTIWEAFRLLKQCRNLKHCKLHIAHDYGHSNDPGQPVEDEAGILMPEGVLFLPYLTSFSVLEDGTDSALTTSLYSSIDAPRLRWLEYHRLPYISTQEILSGDSHPESPILSLLRRSNELKTLLIEPRGFFPADLRKALELVSLTLSHLVVGQESSKFTRYLPGRRRNYAPEPPVKHFDLDWLVTPQDLGNGLSTPLLPHLEVLEWYPGSVSDEVLQRFIRGRMDPSLQIKTSLKEVRILFDRLRQRNVLEELARAGCHTDKIKIELEYISKPPKPGNEPFSPFYGLAKDGRTWIYDDL
ncbi:hypothetical protein CVT26_014832 [Gymnopilus dilepis]|uniref:Uncharacterized protein n=1 Tax=Gymnopilus dilepis TaxID=231916 RepID=A0A409XWW8_9AGAR|nr:hypothetical protein CVT26_014832 [Gymnopilus dilepis]